jgi:hypothetical protein
MMNNKWGAVCIDDVQARFRGERPETCRGNAVRRWTLSRQGYGNDNPGAKSQGMKQLMAGAGVAIVGIVLVPLLTGLFVTT